LGIVSVASPHYRRGGGQRSARRRRLSARDGAKKASAGAGFHCPGRPKPD